ncbi:MAG: outer membrane protein assembly factor BamA, partial [Thermodesulfobacteriota bacterium]|nr:outer membrane protein assembly factor BamA [Thermodesulfobacteriota bacterium]
MRNSISILFVFSIFLLSCLTNEVQSIESKQEIVRSESVINSIEFYGNKIIVQDKIQEYISSKVGEDFNQKKIKDDIKNLYSTGFFYKIDIIVTETDKGLDLLFRFEENPILADFRVKGYDAISLKDIRDTVGLTEGQIISRKKLEITRSIIEQLYFFKGFNKVVVKDNIVPIGESKIQYEVEIVEGRRGYIKGIELVGVHENYKDELLKKIETKTKWFFSPITGRGRLSIDLAELDEGNIKQFYLDKGFVDVKVDKVKIEYIEDKDGYRALFKVDQGHRYKRGVISLKGDLIKDEKDLLDHISLDDSEYFSTRLLNEDIESLNTLYGDESYAFANIDPNIKKDEEQRIIHVEYGIEKGNKFKINLVNITGNTRTRDKVIRREVLINEDDDYSYTEIKASKERINRRGFFESVEVDEKPAKDKPNYLDLNVNVEEKATGYFSIAGGYSSVETLLLGVNIQENNL